MRIYSAESEDALRTRALLKDWARENLITAEQHQSLEAETAADLRTTNVYLRAVLFLFTLVVVAAAIGLFFFLFFSRPSQTTVGIFFLLFAAASYAAAEAAVHRERLYRYGVEEALAVCSTVFLSLGMRGAFFNGYGRAHGPESLVPAAGAMLALWTWHRFGLWYFFLAAMGFVLLLPAYWTTYIPAQHLLTAALYAAGLLLISITRPHFDSVKQQANSLAEAFLWLGIYTTLNLKLSALSLPWLFWFAHAQPGPDLARPFYWLTWVLIWCLPPLILALGIRRKDRFVIAAGALSAVLTFLSNKPYLGWQRHSWDPILLGILLVGVAVYLRRWLAVGPGGVRHGFTAARTSDRDKRWLDATSSTLGLLSPHPPAPAPQTTTPDVQFGGGTSGGAGATGDF